MVTYRKDEKQRPEGWNAGAPPHVGWWSVKGAITSGAEDNMWRSWWDGAKWSAQENSTIADGSFAWNSLGSLNAGDLGTNWCWAWPQNARVARVNPETGEITGSGPCPYETDGKAWPFGELKEKAADAPKLKKKQAGNRKVTRYVLMYYARPIYVADSLQEMHDRIKAMPRISWTHYEKLRNRNKA